MIRSITLCYLIWLLSNFNIRAQSQGLKIKELPSPQKATLHKLSQNSGALWAIEYGNGGVYKSDDLGESWQKKANLKAEFFEKIQFINNTGYVCGDYGYVYKTIDGGTNWHDISPNIEGRITEHYRNDSTKNQKPKGRFIAFYDMYFKDSRNGYVSGFSTQPSEDRPTFEPIAFTTNNGGNTWQEMPYKNLNSLEFINEPPAFISGAFYLNRQEVWRTKNVQKEWVVQSSKDGGITWKQSRLPGFKEGDKWVLRKVLFRDKDHGIVIGGTLNDEDSRALVFYTNDGGKNWTLYPNDWPHLHDAIFLENNERLYLSGKNGFQITLHALSIFSPYTKLSELPDTYQIDGSISINELRDTIQMKEVSKTPLYLIKKTDKFTYIGIRSNNFTILNAYLVDSDSFKILHASAALGQVNYYRSENHFTTDSESFEWIYRDPNTWDEKHPNGVDNIDSFYEQFGWMANTWTMGSYRDFEMLISNQHFSPSTKLFLSFGSIENDAYGIRFFYDGKQVSLTGIPADDKSLHDGYLIKPLKLNPDINEN